jgi:hypothetical protein
MSAVITTMMRVQCDRCPRRIVVEGRTIEETTRLLHEEGWKLNVHEWLCPTNDESHRKAR